MRRNRVCVALVSFVLYYYCCVGVVDGLPFESFWNKTAHFELISETPPFPTFPNDSSTAPANEGSQIIPIGSIWYLFYREVSYETMPSYCNNVIPPFRIVVRTSTNYGKDWSAQKWIIAQPGGSGSPDECAIVDGSAFYDTETQTWHYLGQCIARVGGWSMCHYSLHAPDPRTAMFAADRYNPVVRGGQLFSRICSGPNKHCSPQTVDEGTPDIVYKNSTNHAFYVTFHGYDYSARRSYRGVASTVDWHTWAVAGQNLPNDAIFSSLDCNPWSVSWAAGGCVGGGEGTIAMDEDERGNLVFYQLIEAPDLSLACLTTLNEQNWVLGMMKSKGWARTGLWEQLYHNPLIVPWEKYGCALQYSRIWKDPINKHSYLSYFINDFPTNTALLKIYRLVPGAPAPNSIPIVAYPTK